MTEECLATLSDYPAANLLGRNSSKLIEACLSGRKCSILELELAGLCEAPHSRVRSRPPLAQAT